VGVALSRFNILLNFINTEQICLRLPVDILQWVSNFSSVGIELYSCLINIKKKL